MAERSSNTLSVRIDPDVLADFTKYTKQHRVFSQAQIVESLIRYFMKQGEEQKHLLVMGMGADYLDLIGEALQLLTWGDHAALGSHWLWVIEIYNGLNEISAEAQESAEEQQSAGDSSPNNLGGILSLRRIAWFKLGRAWIDVAKRLRAKALDGLASHLSKRTPQDDDATPDESKPEDWNELYDAATHSLRIAIANFRLFNKSLEKSEKPHHPTVLYNQACCWSLIAQYITEQNANQDLRDLLKGKVQEEDIREREADEQMLEVCLPPSDIPESDHALRKASESLKSITTNYKEEAEGMRFDNVQWMFDFAVSDPDLACFRRGKKDDYDRWSNARKGHSSLLYSYKRLSSRLRKDIASELSNIEKEME
jgi:hypothetical protein